MIDYRLSPYPFLFQLPRFFNELFICFFPVGILKRSQWNVKVVTDRETGTVPSSGVL